MVIGFVLRSYLMVRGAKQLFNMEPHDRYITEVRPDKNDLDVSEKTKTLLIDFDGVIHDAPYGYRDGEIYGKPTDRAPEMIKKLIEARFDCIIFTAREETDFEKIHQWLKKNNISDMAITNKKIPALAYIDDRAVRFTNWTDIVRLYI